MKTTLVNRILLACLLAVVATTLRAAEEQDLIATLQSTADAPTKWAACQRLRIIGTASAVPALGTLLTDQRASQAARHALEGLPYPEAGAALRNSLTKTSGLLKAGVIDSLGWRGEEASVPLLTPLVSDPDSTIAAAAATALGRIGGHDAVAALSAARDPAPAAVQTAVQEGLLKCAERLVAGKDNAGGAAIYSGLFDRKFPAQVRIAAWRGLALSNPGRQTDLIIKALAGTDRPIQVAALKLVRELNDRGAIQACLNQWKTFPADSQLAMLEAQVKLGPEALPTARIASQSADVTLRVAAWQALGELSDTTSIPALAKAAALGEPAEREVARESLARLRGPGAREALLASLENAATPEKAELLRALGERDDHASVNVLLQNAASDVQPVRLAALESLRRLAPPEAIAPLLDVAAKSKSDEQRDPVLKALYAVCEASPNKDQAARSIVQALGRFPTSERRQILPLLAELATPDALTAAQTASRDADNELAKEAVRVLGQWPNAAPARQLLELARTSTEPTLQTLALRGAIEVVGQEPDTTKRLAFLQQAFATAKRPDEKKQALGQIGQVPTSEALALALKNLTDPDLANEACLAAVAIAEKLAPSNPKLADEVAAKVLSQVKEGDLVRRAWALRIKPSSGASFIRDWVVCGPFRQSGIVGATAVFNIPFGPEKPGQNVEWKSVPPGDQANLSALFPGAENCVAYLRTHILAPQDCSGVLLMGSDDGIKAWLNGQVVHSNNVDRGQVVDQDAAPIKLKKGANELLLKVTQGGGGWSACARIMGTDGKPIPGLLVERPTSAAQALKASAAQ
jgi:HEAT repeat protein